MSRSLFAIVLGFVVLYLTGVVAQRTTGQSGIKWWAANGLVVFLFIWFISWTVLYNLSLV
jgi:isoprenylcysteine carboxyl methyltransferase (ICMT) family protein YpbQ